MPRPNSKQPAFGRKLVLDKFHLKSLGKFVKNQNQMQRSKLLLWLTLVLVLITICVSLVLCFLSAKTVDKVDKILAEKGEIIPELGSTVTKLAQVIGFLIGGFICLVGYGILYVLMERKKRRLQNTYDLINGCQTSSF